MKCVEQLVKEIYNSSKIPFQLIIDDILVYTSPEFEISNEFVEKMFYFKNTKCCIKVHAAFSATIDLLGFCIENKLKEVFMNKSNIITSLLNGQEVDEEIILAVYPVLNCEFNIINIYVEKNESEIISYIRECYIDNNIEVIKHKGSILIVGIFEDVLDHVISIEETIKSNGVGKTYISYSNVCTYSNLKKAYEDSVYKIGLAIKYNLSESIFDERKLILEGIVDSVSEEMKSDIFESFDEGFSLLDNEMIKTIEMFFKCGLNLSDAAKELYIHRNTLIYRLDKIQKYTSYDIREFNNAVLFKIVFFLWKEKKQFKT